MGADALERFKEILDFHCGYKGWMHMQMDLPHSSSPPPEYEVKGFETHINCEDGTHVLVREFEGYQKIEYCSPSTGEVYEYDGRTNEILVGVQNDRAFLSAAEFFSGLLDPRFQIQYFRQGREERFELKAVGCEESSGECSSCGPPREITVWAEEGRIRKVRCVKPGETVETNFVFGPPVFETIYDAGAPRNAKVIDNRPAGEVKDILDRLDKRVNEGFGDYVGIITETLVDEDIPHEMRMNAVQVFSENKEAWLWCRYLVGQKFYTKGQPRDAIDVPEGWPVPATKNVLDRVYLAKTTEYQVFDGSRAWMYGREIEEKEKQALPFQKTQSGLPGRIWPDRHRLGLYNHRTRVELVRDNSRPSRIGLQSEVNSKELSESRRKDLFWIDPDREDMPVEHYYHLWEKDEKGGEWEQEGTVHYLNYARLPDGRWYPTHWRETVTHHIESGRVTNVSTREYNLQIVPGMKLEACWFTDPAQRNP